MLVNEKLRELYERHLPDLTELLGRYQDTSYPHLIWVAPAFEKARRRVVFVGQQTNGWEPDNSAAAHMESDLQTRLIDGLLDVYRGFFPPNLPSPFWRAVRQVYAALVPDGPADGYVWANLIKVDQDGQWPPPEADRDWFERFNVVEEEIRILEPDVVVFFTGPVYDGRLMETFPGGRLESILETNSMVARVEHPSLPPHSYRTYHPGYLNRGQWQVIEQLIALCQRTDPRTIRSSEAVQVQNRAKQALANALQEHQGRAAMDRAQPGYAARLEDNLLPGITEAHYSVDFARGAGHELDQKMRAAYSSSALAVNTFARWKKEAGHLRLGDQRGFETIEFEAVCRTGLKGTAPHLDLLARGADGLVGVEVKCTEYLEPHAKTFADSYDDLFARYPHLKRVADEWGFTFFNASQLVKHALGLLKEAKGRPATLLYIFWEPVNSQEYRVFGEHRREVRRFATFLEGGPVRFEPMTLEQLWTSWEMQPGPDWVPAHVQALRARYLVDI